MVMFVHGMKMRLWIIHFALVAVLESQAITNTNTFREKESKSVRRHISQNIDWEIGLREATYQSLIREHFTDPNLRTHITNAPFIGKQDNAVPFGDVVVLARGQLLVTRQGYRFVQDPYRNDCDDCHNKRIRCGRAQCDEWKPFGEEQLIALWTVKKIRHREPTGPRYELEFTISPVGTNRVLINNGQFDYSVPGHIFVIKTYSGNPKNGIHNNYKNYHPTASYTRDNSKPGIYLGVTPDGYKQFLHSFPGYFYSKPNRNQNPAVFQEVPHTPSTTDPKEIELYHKLIQSLSDKTSTSNGPHRFSFNIPDTKPGTSTKQVPVIVTKPSTISTSTTPAATTFVQLPTGQIVPLSDITTPLIPPTHGTTFVPIIPTSPLVPTLQQIPIDTTHGTTVASRPTSTTYQETYPTRPHFRPKPTITTIKPQTTKLMPLTTIHYYTPVEEETTKIQKPSSTLTVPKKPTKPIFSKVPRPNEPISPEEEEKFETDLFSDTQTPKPTTRPFSSTTKRTTIIEYEDDFDLFGPEQPKTESKHPVSINDQLPAPEKGTDTTIPYISSTVSTTTVQETSPKFESTQNTAKQNTLSERDTTKVDISSTRTEASTEAMTSSTTSKTTTEATRTTTASSTYISSPYSTESTTPMLPTSLESTASSKLSTVGTTEATESTTNQGTYTNHFVESTKETSVLSQPPTPPTRFYLPTEEITHPIEKVPITTTLTTETKTETSPNTQTYREPTTEIIEELTHEYVLTSVSPDGTQTFTKLPVTYSYLSTIPTYTQVTEAFKPTYTISKPTASTQNDFLVEPGLQKTSPKGQDFNNDDIFGTIQQTTTSLQPKLTTKAESELANDLFGGKRKSKHYFPSTVPTAITEQNEPKIIYSNFYEASTLPPTTPLAEDYSETLATLAVTPEPTKQYLTSNEYPVTAQSYSTSISFEINKKNNTTPINQGTIKFGPTIPAQISEIHESTDYKIYKAEQPTESILSSTQSTTETKKEFDNVALQLVNHARSIDYLSNKNKSKEPKYKRRIYTPKKKYTRRYQRKNPT